MREWQFGTADAAIIGIHLVAVMAATRTYPLIHLILFFWACAECFLGSSCHNYNLRTILFAMQSICNPIFWPMLFHEFAMKQKWVHMKRIMKQI